jgi:hypothetical protein
LIPEGRNAVYDIALTARPNYPVTVGVTDLSPLTRTQPAQLVFEPESWNVTQQATVAAVQDFISHIEPQYVNVSFQLASNDSNFENITTNLPVGVEDDDQSKSD